MMKLVSSLLFASFWYFTMTNAEIIPETTTQSRFVVVGQYANWNFDGETLQCNYSQLNSLMPPTFKRNEDNSVMFSVPGVYTHQCPSPANSSEPLNTTGSFEVVTAQHMLTVCLSDECNKELSINTGDVVYWTIVGIDNCTKVELTDSENCNRASKQPQYIFNQTTGFQEGYRFNHDGIYQLICHATTIGSDTSTSQPMCDQPLLTITVTLHDNANQMKYSQLVYSHAGIMVATFGLLLPLGAILASFKLTVLHIVLQICGQILSVIGLVLVFVYNQLNNKVHFDQIHSIAGLVIIVGVILIQPAIKLMSLKFFKPQGNIWHKRLGIALVFFGLSNIALGMLALEGIPLYVKVIYGLWVVAAITVYVISGAFTKKEDQDGVAKDGSSYWRSSNVERISLSPPANFAPSKLSKEVINEKNFIQIRKKSIDMLDTAFNTNVNPSPGALGRQRKISNVRFGPIVAEQLSPDPNTPTPNNTANTNFGFGEKNKYTDESDDSNDKGEDTNEEEEEEEEERSSNSDTDAEDDEERAEENNTDKASAIAEIRKSLESINSLPSNGGSIRITRHSARAHTKVSEIFQRSNSFSRPNHLMPMISVDKSESPPSTIVSPSEGPNKLLSPKAETPMSITSDDEQLPKRCPFHRSPNSDSALPLHQRRQRRTGLEMQVPKQDNLSTGRITPIRSPSRSPSFSRKKRDMLVDNTLRSVMQMSDDAIISANAQGEIVFWSNGAMKIFGYTPGEAIGSSLQMIMPQRYKEKHQNGVNKRTDYALDYIKKHHTAPEEQKHARLYAVHGVSKSGKEFGVEVVVTSFVIEGEIYYTGIITETDKGLTRQLSATSLNCEAEIREKQQKAIAIGTQMKIAHKLQSAEHIKKRELENILECSLKASEFEVPADDISKMVDGIIQAADPDEIGVVRFTELIDLLAKHRLYISDSGVIAKYGKSKAEGNLSVKEQVFSKIASVFTRHTPALVWSGIYLVLAIVILLTGVFTSDKNGWEQFAYGTGPLLSFNCVLLLLTSLKGIVLSLKGNSFAVTVFPLNHLVKFHLLLVSMIAVLGLIHTLAHLCSFAFNDNKPNSTTNEEHFMNNLESSVSPLTSGLVICVVLITTLVSSFPILRKLCHFVGFYTIHWVTAVLFYILLLIHGNNHFNPSFWKWLLPFLLVFILDRLYLHFVLKRNMVDIHKAFVYDETSRTIYMEIEKPKRFKFIPGQFIQLNIPQIGHFTWQSCQISSSNKENLKIFLPHTGTLWLKECYKHFKANALNPKPKDGQPEIVRPPITGHIRGAFGCGAETLFNYQAAILVCGNEGPHSARSIVQRFLEYRRSNSCHCGCHPTLMKLYFVWVIPSGNDYEWFTDFLSDIIEDKHIQRYLDIRIYLTNINSPPDELASALMHLALKTGGPALSVKRPSQPQLSKLHSNTSYGTPDFESLLDFVSMQQGSASDREVECGVFTLGSIPYSMETNLRRFCEVCSKKKGPSTTNEMDINSPYRRKLSTDETKSPSPVTQPKEWHITFTLHKLLL